MPFVDDADYDLVLIGTGADGDLLASFAGIAGIAEQVNEYLYQSLRIAQYQSGAVALIDEFNVLTALAQLHGFFHDVSNGHWLMFGAVIAGVGEVHQ